MHCIASLRSLRRDDCFCRVLLYPCEEMIHVVRDNSCRVVSCLVVSCFVSSRLPSRLVVPCCIVVSILSCVVCRLVVSCGALCKCCVALPSLVLSFLVLCCLALSCVVFFLSCAVLFCLFLSCLFLCCFALSGLFCVV